MFATVFTWKYGMYKTIAIVIRPTRIPIDETNIGYISPAKVVARPDARSDDFAPIIRAAQVLSAKDPNRSAPIPDFD